MIDYVKTIIYKICCKDESIKECYVGHTTNFKQRKIEHKYACNNPNSKSYNIKVYSFIREHGGFNNWDFIEIEHFPCNSKKEACMRENYWYFQLKACLNDISPIFDKQKEIIRINRERVVNELKAYFNKKKREDDKQKYLETHAKEIKEHKLQVYRAYAIINRDRINQKMREYNQKTKDRRSELNKKYYEQRKARGYYK